MDNYYDAIMSAIKMASHKATSCIKMTSKDRIIAGWNDLVESKHCIARLAFCD